MSGLRTAAEEWRLNVETAFVALGANRTRSFLTVLGVMIGVLSVTLAIGIGEGARRSVLRSIDSFGSNMAIVTAEPNAGETSRSSEARGRLTERDARAIAAELTGATAVAPQLRVNARLVGVGRNASTLVMGVTPDYGRITKLNLARGRFLSAGDVRMGARVIVLGGTVATRLFGSMDPIGARIRVNRVPFTVIGLLATRGSTFGMDNDDVAMVPLGAARQRLTSGEDATGPDSIETLFVGFAPGADLTEAKRQIRALLRARNRIAKGELEPFTVRTTEEFVEQTSQITGIFQLVLVAIASISLLVGGIGIMNIMLVSVAERTREIGLRMAVGARRSQIRNQFLMESAVLCVLGGAIGLAAALGVALLMQQLADFAVPITWSTGLAAIAFSATVGLVFGVYPASRAARLSPVEALRSE